MLSGLTPVASAAEMDVLGDRHGLEEAFDLAVLRHIDDSVAHGRPRRAVADRPLVEPDAAAMEEVALQHAADDLHRLGAAGADQAEEAGHLAGKTEKEVLRTMLPMERFWTLSIFVP